MPDKSPPMLLQRARGHIFNIASLLREKKTERAIAVIIYGLVIYVKHGHTMLSGGKKEYENLLTKGIYFLNLDSRIKNITTTAIEYVPGQETTLLSKLQILLKLVQIYKTRDEEQKSQDTILKKNKQMEKGKHLLQKRCVEGALKIFHRVSRQYNDDPHVHAKIGRLLFSINHIECITFLKTAVQLDPADHVCHALMGTALRKARQFEQARDAYLAALEHDGTNTTYMFNLARIYMESCDWVNARNVLTLILELDPSMKPAQKALEFANKNNRHLL
jgi:tetratricopeptide (TPR) repeat protein